MNSPGSCPQPGRRRSNAASAPCRTSSGTSVRQGLAADRLFQRASDGMRAEGALRDEAMALRLRGADEARGRWAAMGAERFADAARM